MLASLLALVVLGTPQPSASSEAAAFRAAAMAERAARYAERVERSARRGPVHASRTDTTIDVSKGTILELYNFSGDISVRAWPKSSVRILAEHSARSRILSELRGNKLGISSVSRHGVPSVVEYTLTVPQWMPVQLSGVDVEISVDGVLAGVRAASVKGDVSLRGGGGDVQLSSIEGSVRVRDSKGTLVVSTVNNDLTLERVSGTVDAQSINGSIRLAEMLGPNVDASSINGLVRFSGAFSRKGRYRFASHNGDLQVGVPADAGLDVSVATFNGEFESKLPGSLAPHQKGKRFSFTLGQGGTLLELESFQGLIQLLRDGSPELRLLDEDDLRRQRPVSRIAPRAPTSPKTPKPPKAPKAPGDESDEDEEEAP